MRFFVWLAVGLACIQNISCTSSTATTTQRVSPPDPYANAVLLVKDPSINDYFDLNAHGVQMKALSETADTLQNEIRIFPDEYESFRFYYKHLPIDSLIALLKRKGTLRWPDSLKSVPKAQVDTFQYKPDARYPLLGLRVALDPGHIAGDMEMAMMEGKYVKMLPTPQTRLQRVSFFEADLNLATAHLIRKKLQALGAQVLMTRTAGGVGALGIGFDTWKEERWEELLQKDLEEDVINAWDYKWWKRKASDKMIMSRYFVHDDLRERARLINRFQPHLTFVIHYNVHSPNWEERDADGNVLPTGANYCMAFVPGSFMKNELSTPESRVNFLGLLLTKDIDASIRLADAFVRHSTRLTGVPLMDGINELSYLKHACLPLKQTGVFARNLSLSRLVRGPICYGESLCQDNIVESLALNRKDFEVEGIRVSRRIEDIADAYIATTLEFVQQ